MNNSLFYYQGRMHYQGFIFDLVPIQPGFNQKLFKLGVRLKKINPLDMFKERLADLYYDEAFIVGQAITPTLHLKPQLVEKGFTENDFANYLRIAVADGYLDKYGSDSSLVCLTSKGVKWIDGESKKVEIKNSEFIDESLKSKLPIDIAEACSELNFSIANEKNISSMLLLRRILPLAIVRKFQSMGKEGEIKDKDGEFLEPKMLLEKIKPLLKTKRIFNEVSGYKFLLDSTQHSYTYTPKSYDVEQAVLRIRMFLEDIYSKISL